MILKLPALHIKACTTTKYSLLSVVISYKSGLSGSAEFLSGDGGRIAEKNSAAAAMAAA